MHYFEEVIDSKGITFRMKQNITITTNSLPCPTRMIIHVLPQ